MSRHPSPGPSMPHVAAVSQVFQAVPPPPPSLPNPNNRQKSKTFTPGIAAGAEDVKYQAKYKELKRKVKEIEADNDKLQFKVLQAKKSINRMKIERAVLYDRLSQVPPSPDMNDRQPLPPVHSGPGIPPPPPSSSLHLSPYMAAPGNHQPRDTPMDPNDRARAEYLHTHSHSRMGTGPDTRPVQDSLPMGPGVVPPPSSTHTATNTLSSSASGPHSSSRHGPSSGHDSPHQLPPLLSKMVPSVQSHLDPPRSHTHPYSPQMPPHTGSPHTHSHSNSRSHSSSSRSRGHQQASAQYSQQHSVHQHPSDGGQHLRSSPLPGEREREREKPRRHEGHERTASHSRHHIPPVTKNPMHSPPGTRMSSRIHQQHVDRSPLTQNELEREREREIESEREWENDQRLIAREQLFEREQMAREREASAHSHQHHHHRMPSPPFTYRPSRQAMERSGDYHESPSFKLREEQSYHHNPSGHSNKLSRSGTPLSGSGGSGLADGGPPRPDSRGNGGQYYDRDRTRPYAARQPPPDDEYVREERRPHSRDHSTGFASSERPYSEARKRNHHEMELDGEREGEAPSALVSGSRKRIHQEHASARGADSQEEDEGMDA